MRGVFDERESERAVPRRDTELTLGSFTLLAIFFGLVLLCGLFFGLGYTMGHRGADAAPAAAASVPAALQVDSSRSKPSAAPQNAPEAAPAAGSQAAAPAAAPTLSQTAEVPSAGSPVPAQATAANSLSGPAPVAGGPPASSAKTNAADPAASLMVQIAAVTHQEDADVLVGALRRRGYAVTAHRDAGDGLIHVRVGPFSSRDEADKWRVKLLNDGYNAIVQ